MAIYDGNGNLLTFDVFTDNMVKNHHYGESAYLVGDSNFQFLIQANSEWPDARYFGEMFNNLGMTFTCNAVSGASWYSTQEDFHNSKYQVDWLDENVSLNEDGSQNTYSICIVMLGTNDSVVGTYEDESGTESMVGSMKYCLDKLKTRFQNGVILGIIPPKRYDTTSYSYDSMGEKIELMKKIYADYSIKAWNCYDCGGIAREQLREDLIHLNGYGRTIFCDGLEREILSI